VIALDGPAASGKSTVGLGAARRLGLRFFDTGLLYRALTWLALGHGTDMARADAVAALVADLQLEIDEVGSVFRAGVDITPSLRSGEVDASVSRVSAHATVRSALVPVQRGLVRAPGLILVGRDIGTIIVPDAQLKIWLNASPEERARRRAEQTSEDYSAVLEGMRQRDHMDSSRAVAPMTRSVDAVVVDTDHASADEVIEQVVKLSRERGLQVAERGSSPA